MEGDKVLEMWYDALLEVHDRFTLDGEKPCCMVY